MGRPYASACTGHVPSTWAYCEYTAYDMPHAGCMVYGVYFMLYAVCCIVHFYTVCCVLYSTQYSLLYAVYTVQYTAHSAPYTVHCTLHTTHCALHTAPFCTPCTVHCALGTVYLHTLYCVHIITARCGCLSALACTGIAYSAA